MSVINPSRETPPLPLSYLGFALVGAGVFAQVEGIPAILVWVIQMLFHELGHALAYWLTGRFAVPSFGVTLAFSEDRSWIFSTLLVGVLVLAVRYFQRERMLELLRVCQGALVLLFIGIVLLPRTTADLVVLVAGLAGEFLLAVGAIVLAWSAVPRRWNWATNRYVFLVLGAVSLVSATVRWLNIYHGNADLPFGAVFDFGAVFGSGESNGDLDRLIRDYGFTVEKIIRTYLVILAISWLLLGVWLVRAFRVFRGTGSRMKRGSHRREGA